MYKTILDIIEGQGWDDTGVPLSNAERFLFDCCTSRVERIVIESDEPASGFSERIHETKVAIEELRPIIEQWIILMDKVDEEITHDGSRHSVERAASFMLMKWSSIVTQQ